MSEIFEFLYFKRRIEIMWSESELFPKFLIRLQISRTRKQKRANAVLIMYSWCSAF